MAKRKRVEDVQSDDLEITASRALPRKKKAVTTNGAAQEPAPKKHRSKPSDEEPKVENEYEKQIYETKDRRKKKVQPGVESKASKMKQPVEEDIKPKRAKKTPKKAAAKKVKEEDISEVEANVETAAKPKPKKRRKTKEEKEAEAMPVSARTQGHKLFIGAHVSGAGGVHKSILNSVHIGANAFALFLKSQRKWANPALADDACTSFLDNCKSHAYDQAKHVVPHGSYLVNLAHTDKARTEQAYESFLDDLKRCERLGIKLYNFHPGVANSVNGDRPKAIAHLASNINRAHKDTSSVVTLLENMAHGGNVLGSTLEDLRDIIALVHKKDRVGVCLDTCHAFAGGYDLRTSTAFKATMEKFESIVGIKYLRAVHMNDSKAPFASHRDLHANIGTGFLGLRAFHSIVNDARFEGLPLILETPLSAKDENGVLLKDDKGKEREDKIMWAREIKLLESLVGMDAEGAEFLKLENQLARKGEPDRKKLAEQFEKKREKEEKKAKGKGKKKGRKQEKADDADDEEESALSDLESDGDDDDGVDDTQRFAD